MKLLLDTHAFLWFLEDDARLTSLPFHHRDPLTGCSSRRRLPLICPSLAPTSPSTPMVSGTSGSSFVDIAQATALRRLEVRLGRAGGWHASLFAYNGESYSALASG